MPNLSNSGTQQHTQEYWLNSTRIFVTIAVNSLEAFFIYNMMSDFCNQCRSARIAFIVKFIWCRTDSFMWSLFKHEKLIMNTGETPLFLGGHTEFLGGHTEFLGGHTEFLGGPPPQAFPGALYACIYTCTWFISNYIYSSFSFHML